MQDFVRMTCRSCGGKLKITPEMDHFACGHCGTEFMVRRGDTTISLSPVVESITRVEEGVDRVSTAVRAQLKAKRVHAELMKLEEQLEARETEIRGFELQRRYGCWYIPGFIFTEARDRERTELDELRAQVDQKRQELHELEDL